MLSTLRLNTVATMTAFGKLMRRIAQTDDFSDMPGVIEDNGRRLVISREAFLKMLAEEMGGGYGTETPDVSFRDDPAVTEIELIRRQPNRGLVVLPESVVLAGQAAAAANGDKVPVVLPTVYGEMISPGALAWMEGAYEQGTATYEIKVNSDVLDTFMGGYTFFQCA